MTCLGYVWYHITLYYMIVCYHVIICENTPFWVSPCLAILRQKLPSGPRFGAPKASIPNSNNDLSGGAFFTDTAIFAARARARVHVRMRARVMHQL